MIRYDSILRARIPKLKGLRTDSLLGRAFCVASVVCGIAMNQAQVAFRIRLSNTLTLPFLPHGLGWAEVSGACCVCALLLLVTVFDM